MNGAWRRGGPFAWCLLAAALFGASVPASKALLGSMRPLLLSGLLYVGAGLAVAPWALGTKSRRALRESMDRRNLWLLAGAVLFGGILGPVLLLTGLSMSNAGDVSLWLNLETVATAVLARVFFREHLTRSTWLAVAFILGGSFLLSPHAPGGGLGILLVALACVAWGLDNNLTAVIDRFSPAQVTFAKGLIAGTVNVALGLLAGDVSVEVPQVGAALLIGGLSYGASLILYVAGAQQLGATRSQLVFATAPVWGLVMSWAALGESIAPLQVLAAALMGLALYVWHREKHAHAHVHERMTHRHWHRHDDDHHDHAHDVSVPFGHSHEHTHEPMDHEHPHEPDLHHRHEH